MPRIAACTSRFQDTPDFAAFARHVRALLDLAGGADLVVLPELVTWELMTAVPGWSEADDLQPAMDTARFADQFRDLMAAEARDRRQHLLAGTHLVEQADGGYRNVATLFDDAGRLIHEHAKSHLFPVEHTVGITEGDEMAVVELPFAVVGINICYEAEIPECSASLTEQGLQLLLCPSQTFTEAGFWRVRHTLASRAIENQVYAVHSPVSGAAQGAWPGAWGRSSVLSPCDTGWPANGVLAEAAPNVDGAAIADIDLGLLAENRRSGAATTFSDRRRRADLYRSWPSHIPSP